MADAELTTEQKLFNVKKKINELKRGLDRRDHLDIPMTGVAASVEMLTPRQARAILRAALAEIEGML